MDVDMYKNMDNDKDMNMDMDIYIYIYMDDLFEANVLL